MSDKNYRVLLVDDTAEDREMYRIQLCQDDECMYTFAEAENGAEGIALAAHEHFDCILLDYRMPDQDGLEFLSTLKATCGGDHAPVVMITGQGNERIAVQALRLGARDYLIKAHITPESIHRATQNAIEKCRQERALAAETARNLALQEQLSLLVEGARDHALILLDPAGAIATWNSAAVHVTGFEDEDAVGRNIQILFFPEDIEAGVPLRELRHAEHFGKIDVERWLRKKNEAPFWASGSVSALRYGDGSLRGFAKIIRDETTKKRLLDEQANRHKWLERLLDMMPFAFLLIDHRSGQVMFANTAAATLAGGHFPYSESFADYPINYQVFDVNGNVYPADQHPWIALAMGQMADVEVMWQIQERRTYLWVTSRTLPPMFGRDPAVILCLQDITALKNIEQELVKAKAVAEEAALAKSSFLANMSHEIRTPLHAILGFAEMLSGDATTETQRTHYADVIERNGKMLVHLIDSILDLSKIEAGQLEVDAEPVVLRQVVLDVIELFEPEAAAKGVRLEINLGQLLPPRMFADELRLKQILFNMVSNALKFTDTGKIIMTVMPDPFNVKESGEQIIFSVRDTGIGISSTQQEQLFQAFSQGDSSITRRYGGSGLGLVLCARLAELMGGRFELVRSQVDVGSEFALKLPSCMPDFGATINLAGDGPNDEDALVTLTGKLILLVEDTKDNQELILQALQETGAVVHIAENGDEAIQLVDTKEFDLILMDVQMPSMDGQTTTQLLREAGYSKPIIGLSANAFNDDRIKSLEAGMDDYLTKPISPKALLTAIYHRFRHDTSANSQD